MEALSATPPTGSENSSEDESTECEFHDLIVNDDFYEEVEARLVKPNLKDNMGYSLLHAAAWCRGENSRVLRYLLGIGAVRNSATIYGHTPLHFAAACRKRNAVAALIEANASVNAKDFFDRTPLHFAIGTRWSYPPVPILSLDCDMWIVERLISHPEIDINTVDESRNTPLMWAARRRNSDAVEALVKKIADPNIANKHKRTPLHKALSPRNPSYLIVSSLLSNGAGIYCVDKYGKTPMDILLCKVRANSDDDTLLFAKFVVWLVALRYKIRLSLVRELKKVSNLYKYLRKCWREASQMKRQIVYENFTLHDFACDCFHLNVNDPVQDIYIPVVNLLISGSYTQYSDFILKRMTAQDLRNVIARTNSSPWVQHLLADSSQSTIFWVLRVFRNEIFVAN